MYIKKTLNKKNLCTLPVSPLVQVDLSPLKILENQWVPVHPVDPVTLGLL